MTIDGWNALRLRKFREWYPNTTKVQLAWIMRGWTKIGEGD